MVRDELLNLEMFRCCIALCGGQKTCVLTGQASRLRILYHYSYELNVYMSMSFSVIMLQSRATNITNLPDFRSDVSAVTS